MLLVVLGVVAVIALVVASVGVVLLARKVNRAFQEDHCNNHENNINSASESGAVPVWIMVLLVAAGLFMVVALAIGNLTLVVSSMGIFGLALLGFSLFVLRELKKDLRQRDLV